MMLMRVLSLMMVTEHACDGCSAVDTEDDDDACDAVASVDDSDWCVAV